MFGEVSSSSITVWEPGYRYATQEDKNPDGTFMAFEWLIESRDGGGAVVRVVHSGLLGENWEAEYNRALLRRPLTCLPCISTHARCHDRIRAGRLSSAAPGG